MITDRMETRLNGIEKDPQFASTLAHGIDILLSFRVGESALGNKDFAARTGLSRPAVARLTHTLTCLGYLRHDKTLQKYRLGAPVISLGYPLLANMRIRQVAQPLMRELSERTGGAVSLGMRDRDHMIYVETSRSTERLVMMPDIGSPLPMLNTAMGRAWLAKAPAAEREAVLNRIWVNEPDAYARDIGPARQAVRDFAQRKYCVNRGEWRADYGFAVPLARLVDATQFVFNCGMPMASGAFDAIERAVAPQLVAMVRRIEALLEEA